MFPFDQIYHIGSIAVRKKGEPITALRARSLYESYAGLLSQGADPFELDRCEFAEAWRPASWAPPELPERHICFWKWKFVSPMPTLGM